MGMQTFDTALYHLYNDGKITLEEALKNADAENNLRLRIELGKKGEVGADGGDAFDGLSLVEEPDEEEEDEVFGDPNIDHKINKDIPNES
jgi:twitching motility protein PilU